MTGDHPFALLLTHDVDRPYKTYQALYRAVADRSPRHLADLRPGRRPYWQFEGVTALEDDLGVRSAFYFLREPPLPRAVPPRGWFRPRNWVEHLGRYDPSSPEVAAVVRELAAGGWEVGLHGSRRAGTDADRLAEEVAALESVLAGETGDGADGTGDDGLTGSDDGPVVRGGRQHHLSLSVPETWRNYAAAGLRYDCSYGSATDWGFRYGRRPLRPFDDDFVVFPLTAMETHLPDPGEDFAAAWAACRDLLSEAAATEAVATVLWHPRYFCEADFPGYRRLYRRLVERALEMGAWVGPPGDLYDRMDHPACGPTADGQGASDRRIDGVDAQEPTRDG